MASPRKLLRRALDALDTIEADAARIPAAAQHLDDALGASGRAELGRARALLAEALAALEARAIPERGGSPPRIRQRHTRLGCALWRTARPGRNLAAHG